MSRLHDLLRQLEKNDAKLAADLRTEFDALADRRSFGLNFERHVPEAVELPGRPVRKGDKVRVLPPRGEKRTAEHDVVWRVTGITKVDGVRIGALVEPGTGTEEHPLVASEAPVDDLVVVSEFRDPIYPGLVSTGRVERGGDKPFHTVINAENFHALQALLFTHRGKVDCIYIDPPYNSGAKDWKYDNDYVESEDVYRHSKWLAMMERRMLLAKELLNPDDSVLIVTIDEKEYLRLGLLLQQTFPAAKVQMITSVISRNGTNRDDEFSRVEEYLFVLRFGAQSIVRNNDNMLSDAGAAPVSRTWFNFMRTSTMRESLEGQFYPIIVNTTSERIVRLGSPLGKGVPMEDPELAADEVAVWPIREDGAAATWGAVVSTANEILGAGYMRVGAFDKKSARWSVQYVREGDRKRVADGVIRIVGKLPDGSNQLEYVALDQRESIPKTVWNRVSHDATSHGTRVLKEVLPGRRFPYPKSLYAVEDVMRFFVANKMHAVILDFFSGSGTTAHAVMRLNKQDGGKRQAILVTNNEVSADEQKKLRGAELRPGDDDWEALGICDFITKPRIEAAITGRTPDGEPIKGDYKFTDEFPMADGFEENAEFFTLTYESALQIKAGRAFSHVAPLLWMRAGSEGRRIEALPNGWDVADTYGVLEDLDRTTEFLEALVANERATVAFIVTDEDRLFETIVAELPSGVEPVRLYDAYVRNFEIEAGRLAR